MLVVYICWIVNCVWLYLLIHFRTLFFLEGRLIYYKHYIELNEIILKDSYLGFFHQNVPPGPGLTTLFFIAFGFDSFFYNSRWLILYCGESDISMAKCFTEWMFVAAYCSSNSYLCAATCSGESNFKLKNFPEFQTKFENVLQSYSENLWMKNVEVQNLITISF